MKTTLTYPQEVALLLLGLSAACFATAVGVSTVAAETVPAPLAKRITLPNRPFTARTALLRFTGPAPSPAEAMLGRSRTAAAFPNATAFGAALYRYWVPAAGWPQLRRPERPKRWQRVRWQRLQSHYAPRPGRSAARR